ncbi:DNA helicase-2/ATP-dependent DNA helicase PcrA [Hydrogenoanaerobacterium saccharovorans]|uniref:DNA 3'-5' helicase n=1 Tax=Hydrogenoanaerobacterium saccharovorans TaxID=474960 RepID=A0A1H8B0Q3_9FIRM|nr:ATP-dependent helicase [Hydrogenoanaerobacterium saccharovorans]RPF47683.1 DNA helicase-2/ATP-dependent DNA helicase PcrA [Hydrogenoanaerobacterium saccharovorans]SEM75678.1 DNA helicase-2 / ATP-dependent DNA helicase PcrA [Hydrogenoanaerobacterium saccharovorans]
MSNTNLEKIKEKITAQHEGDEKQLEVIFSDSPRLIVEAPAGYGKTTTMISRIAYLFASGRIPNPKRILGLTFSVNAALKVKREVAGKLPSLLGSQNSPVAIGEKVTVTNYHGFCKGILKKYGYLISDALRKDINLFRAVGDSDIEKHASLKTALTSAELQSLKAVGTAVKEARVPNAETIHAYNDIVIKKLLPLDYVTHNAVILFVLEIFENHTEVKKFYQNYYPLVVVDEFQDTNCIAWALLESVISNQTQLLFLGDPLQRIYGFIGALPDIMSKVLDEHGMAKVSLSKNYRFRNNPEMLKLDKNIRANAASCFTPIIADEDSADLPIFWGLTQQDEAEKVVAKVQALRGEENAKIAILFRGRGKNAEIVEAELAKNNIPYFYGMFTDEDTDYIEFHNKCQDMFIRRFGKSKSINKKALRTFSDSVKTAYAASTDKTVDSLLWLLDALVEKVAVDYADLVPEDKYTLLLDIFENRQLKQAMEYVDSQVIISTIHGAKGLEWDFVIICDVEQWVFTFTCRDCPSKLTQNSPVCRLPQKVPTQMVGTLLDDLCVFYVALTRARRQAFISASGERYNARGQKFTGGKICCFALVNGVTLINAATNSGD